MSNLHHADLTSLPATREQWGPVLAPIRTPLGLCEDCGKVVVERDVRGRIRAAHYWCENVCDSSDFGLA
jgi:hypothetical protein